MCSESVCVRMRNECVIWLNRAGREDNGDAAGDGQRGAASHAGDPRAAEFKVRRGERRAREAPARPAEATAACSVCSARSRLRIAASLPHTPPPPPSTFHIDLQIITFFSFLFPLSFLFIFTTFKVFYSSAFHLFFSSSCFSLRFNSLFHYFS